MTDLPLTKISETADKLVLGHDPVPGAVGFRIAPIVKDGQVQDGKWAHTWDGARTRHSFAPGHPPYRVQALMAGPEGAYPATVTPPPPTGVVVAPPVGPFQVIDGGGTTFQSPLAYRVTAQSARLGKLHVKNMTGRGVGSMQGYPPTVPMPARSVIEDCVVENVAANPPLSAGGTSEACAWIGNPTDARRLTLRNGAWMGMWTGSRCIGSTIEDFTIEGPGVGLYTEHVTRDSVFRRFKIHSQDAGILMEWWYKQLSYGPGYVGYGEMEGTSGCLFEDGEIYCPASSSDKVAGVFADAGTYGNTFRRIRFWGPGVALRLPDPTYPAALVDPTRPNVVEDCVFDQDGPDIIYHRRKIGWNGQ